MGKDCTKEEKNQLSNLKKALVSLNIYLNLVNHASRENEMHAVENRRLPTFSNSYKKSANDLFLARPNVLLFILFFIFTICIFISIIYLLILLIIL